uniref:Reverse transcriptase/retrotransposon-derived protein RNase H-like domain-containing protein n=1 Tax=Aquila chrysaetos chrysaetos TaxID=223781 RepID=A0A663EAI7_AQUCH
VDPDRVRVIQELNEEVEPIKWGPEREKAFRILKGALLKAPASGIPDYTKPFKLYCVEMKGVTNAVVVQTLGPHGRPVAYYSHILDPVIRGTPFCIRAVAAAAGHPLTDLSKLLVV